MSYIVKWSNKANKILQKLPQNIALRIWDKTEEIKQNPFRFLQPFEGDSCFKLRIGDYRLLIDVDLKEKILVVRILDKRGRVYKNN